LATGLTLTSDQLRDLARRGAVERLRELRDEKTQIEALLGDATSGPTSNGRPPTAAPARRRRRMSAAQRRAVGARMRKYWAARRKAEGRA